MLRVAISGNIGSGKSTVCRIFESLGIRVYYADKEAKKFYKNPDVFVAVKKLFGDLIYDQDGNLKRADLARIVFNDPQKLKQLNAIIHPLVLQDFLQWSERNKKGDYILYESALLFESGFIKYFDQSILVTAPAELAMLRVMERDGISEEDFISRAANQNAEDHKLKLADHIIENDERSPLIPRVIALHDTLKKHKLPEH